MCLHLYLWTSLTSRVCSSRSLSGSSVSQIRFWLALTATPLQTQREHRTSRIWANLGVGVILILDKAEKNLVNMWLWTCGLDYWTRFSSPCGSVHVCRAERWWIRCGLSEWYLEPLDSLSRCSEGPPECLRGETKQMSSSGCVFINYVYTHAND